MLNDTKTNINIKEVINKTKKEETIIGSSKPKFRYFLIGILLALAAISATYLLTSKSNITNIVVNDNIYLKDEDIIKLSDLSINDKFIFVNPGKAESLVKEHPLIDSCGVVRRDDQSIEINVVERKVIGYCYEDDENVLILANDSRIVLDKENLYLIGKAPLIEGFGKDEILLIERNMSSVDYKMINEVSEIHFFPELKFQNYELIMRDGNYIFTSVYGLNVLNKYYDIVSSYEGEGYECYYVEDISGNVYISACPWETIEEENTEIKQEEDISEEE